MLLKVGLGWMDGSLGVVRYRAPAVLIRRIMMKTMMTVMMAMKGMMILLGGMGGSNLGRTADELIEVMQYSVSTCTQYSKYTIHGVLLAHNIQGME